MTINPASIPAAALPPSVKGGGNGPAKRPASGDPFASVIAQILGVDESGAAGNTLRGTGSLASRKRGTEALDDLGGSAVSSKHDADDPMIINVAAPAWLWTVQDQPGSLGPVPLAPPQTAGSAGATGDTLESTGSSGLGTAPGLGVGAGLFPGMDAVPLVGASGQAAVAAAQPDQSDQLSSSTVAVPVGEQSTPALPAVVSGAPSGVGAGIAGQTGASFVPSDRPAGPAGQSDTTDPQSVSSASTNQPGSAPSRIPTPRAGRVTAAYADTSNVTTAQELRHAGQSANGPAAPPAFSSSSQAGSNRIADKLRASTDRGAGAPPVLADTQGGLAAAFLTGRAQNGTAHDPADQDSAHSSADSQGRAEDTKSPVAQALNAAVAQALDATAAGTTVHPDPALLHTAGQTAGPASSLDGTTAATAAPLLSGLADRSSAIDDASLHRQMVQAIHLQSRNGVGAAQITLQPEYLGEVTITLRVEDGGVTAQVSAASTEVREWLSANQSLLRQGLSEQGLTLDRLVVSDEPAEPSRGTKGGNARQQQQSQQDQEPRPRPRRDTSTFEITV